MSLLRSWEKRGGRRGWWWYVGEVAGSLLLSNSPSREILHQKKAMSSTWRKLGIWLRTVGGRYGIFCWENES